MKIPFQSIGTVLREAVRGFRRHHAPRLGAALAFYTLLSLSPLLLVVLAVLGPIFGTEAARGSLTLQIEALVGTEGARAIEALLSNASEPARSWPAALLGGVVMLIGASGVFVQLKESLDAVWETPPEESKGLGLSELLFDRLLAFTAICGLAFLLMVSLTLSAILSALGDRLAPYSAVQTVYAEAANLTISFLVTTLLFAMIFKLLPEKRPPWRRVWFGSLVTAVLFMIGKSLIGLYLGHAAVGSAYGVAGSLVVLLVWIYYSTQILLFGAELTRAGDMELQPIPSESTPAHPNSR